MSADWKQYRRELVRGLRGYLLAAGVSLVFYLFAIPRLEGPAQHLRFLLTSLMYGSVIFSWIWGLYAAQWALLLGRRRAKRIGWPNHLLLGASGTAFGLVSAMALEALLWGEPFSMARFSESLLIGLFIAMMFQFYYAYRNTRLENLELQNAQSRAELQALRSQMQPHFLFNSLNSLAALIEQDPALAGAATQKLADLYRLILESSREPLASLQHELRIMTLYLEIERIRFGQRLELRLPEAPAGLRQVPIPSLLLQTLAENAVKHGISKSLGGGFVELRLEDLGRELRFSLRNSGAPLREPPGEGSGLRNSRERLKLLYGPDYPLSLVREADGGTVARFGIPVRA